MTSITSVINVVVKRGLLAGCSRCCPSLSPSCLYVVEASSVPVRLSKDGDVLPSYCASSELCYFCACSDDTAAPGGNRGTQTKPVVPRKYTTSR